MALHERRSGYRFTRHVEGETARCLRRAGSEEKTGIVVVAPLLSRLSARSDHLIDNIRISVPRPALELYHIYIEGY